MASRYLPYYKPSGAGAAKFIPPRPELEQEQPGRPSPPGELRWWNVPASSSWEPAGAPDMAFPASTRNDNMDTPYDSPGRIIRKFRGKGKFKKPMGIIRRGTHSALLVVGSSSNPVPEYVGKSVEPRETADRYSLSCSVLMCASRAREYSRSASNSDRNFRTSPSRRKISIFSLYGSLAAALRAGEAAAVAVRENGRCRRRDRQSDPCARRR